MLMNRILWRMCCGLAVAAALFTLHTTRVLAEDRQATTDAGATADDASAEAADAEESESDESTENDGVRVQGKIIVIGPDGEQREFDFGRNFPKDGPLKGPRVRMFRFEPGYKPEAQSTPRDWVFSQPPVALGDYMIGLHCEPAGETVRAQLGLGEKGLVVRTVIEESPAAKAGLQVHDVLVRVGDQELTDVRELLDAVQAAKETPLSFTLIRGAEEQTVEITPAKREDVKLPWAFEARVLEAAPEMQRARRWFERHHLDAEDFRGDGAHFRLQAIGPGIVLRKAWVDNVDAPQLQEQIDELNNQLEALQKTVDELTENNN